MAGMEEHSGNNRNSEITEVPLHGIFSRSSKELPVDPLFLGHSTSEEHISKTAKAARRVSPDKTLPKCCWARRLDACGPSRSIHRYDDVG